MMQQSPATFIHVIDLTNTNTEIADQVHYWLNFIDTATCKITTKSCIIVVGSHADLLTSDEKLQEKSSLVTSLVQRKLKRLEYIGMVTMDCRKKWLTHEFISLLYKSHQVIIANAPINH